MGTPGARTTDPDTSHRAAAGRDDDRSQIRELLLAAWYKAGADGLTDEEAGRRAGVEHRTYWKRAGELRQPARAPSWMGFAGPEPLIAWDYHARTRIGVNKTPRRVSVITDAGRRFVHEHGLVEAERLITGADLHTLPAGAAVVLHTGPDGNRVATRTAAIHVGDGVLGLVNARDAPVRRRALDTFTYRILWLPPTLPKEETP